MLSGDGILKIRNDTVTRALFSLEFPIALKTFLAHSYAYFYAAPGLCLNPRVNHPLSESPMGCCRSPGARSPVVSLLGALKARLHRRFLSQQLNAIFVARSCNVKIACVNQLPFQCDFSQFIAAV